MFDYRWIEHVKEQAFHSGERPTLLIAEGLCQYFTEEENKELFRTIADRLPFAHILVHSICPSVAENTDISPAVSSTKAKFKWGIAENIEMERWDRRFKLLDEWHFIRWHRLRWIKAGVPLFLPSTNKFLYQNMKVALLRLGEFESHWPKEGK